MAFKEAGLKLQLCFDEYIETWSTLIREYYLRGLDPELTEAELSLSDEGIVRYAAELSAILLVIVSKIIRVKMRIPVEIREKVAEAAALKLYSDLYPEEAGLIDEQIAFFHSRQKIFDQICSRITSLELKKRQNDMIGLARYLTAQVSEKDERENAKAIERLSLLFIDLSETALRLSGNSALDNMMVGKPKFIVQK